LTSHHVETEVSVQKEKVIYESKKDGVRVSSAHGSTTSVSVTGLIKKRRESSTMQEPATAIKVFES